MKIHYLQHVPFENLGSFEKSFIEKGHSVSCTKLYEGNTFPSVEDFDWLVVMGGPMGIFDENEYPWLAQEKHFIKAAIDGDKTVLGICLGAQLIAHVLGAPVYYGGHLEIGWFELRPTQEMQETPLASVFSGPMDVFHWHGDTFDIPEGAQLIGSSDGCTNQGFVFENNVVGLQFHLETTPQSAIALLTNCGNELDATEYVQSPAEIRANRNRFIELNKIADKLLTALGA